MVAQNTNSLCSVHKREDPGVSSVTDYSTSLTDRTETWRSLFDWLYRNGIDHWFYCCQWSMNDTERQWSLHNWFVKKRNDPALIDCTEKHNDPLLNCCTLYTVQIIQKLHDPSLIEDVQIRSNYGDSKRSADFLKYIPFTVGIVLCLDTCLIRIICKNISWVAYNSIVICKILVRTFYVQIGIGSLVNWHAYSTLS